MYKLLIIGLGGFVGTVLRYGLGGFFQSISKSYSFPYGTLAVNLIGCFVIGLLSQLTEARGLFSQETRLFIFIGILGAFTTFSTFGSETVNLLRNGENVLSLLNVGAHIFIGLFAVWLGRVVGLLVWR